MLSAVFRSVEDLTPLEANVRQLSVEPLYLLP
jgi:hypothetical protein